MVRPYVPGTLLNLFHRQQDFNEAIVALKKLRKDRREDLTEYEYASIHTLIRLFEIKVNEKIK